MNKKAVKTVLAAVLAVLLCVCSPMQVIAESGLSEQLGNSATQSEENKVYENETHEDETQTEILYEIDSKRTPYTKCFKMSDGSYLSAQYPVPVHYLSDGVYEEYDNSLSEAASTADDSTPEYKNKKSDKDIRLKTKAHQKNMVKLSSGSNTITWGYSGINNVKGETVDKPKSPDGTDERLIVENVTREVWYYNAYDNVDMQFLVSSDGIKENIYLNNADAQTTFDINYKTNGLTAYVVDEKTIELRDGDKTVYTISAPIMSDAHGNMSDDITLSILMQRNKTLIIRLTADSEWINAADRAYPICIDPTFTERLDSESDVSIISANSGDPSSSSSANSGFTLGRASNGTIYRAFVKINRDLVSDADTITNARFTAIVMSSTGEMNVNAHAAIKWPTGSNGWDYDDYYNQVIDTSKIREVSGMEITSLTVDITRIVKSGQNCFALEADEDGNTNSCGVTPTYHGSSPLVTVSYRSNRGLESYWSYTQVDAGAAGTAYINNYSGNLVFVRNEVSTSGFRMPVTLQSVYDGYSASKYITSTNPVVGKGWRFNLQQTVKAVTDTKISGQYPYVYTDGDGTDHYFIKTGDNEYVDEDGLQLTLKEVSSGYEITTDDHDVYSFNSSGNLYLIKDSNENEININFSSGSISSISDAAGHTIDVIGGTDSHLCQNVRDQFNRAITYTNSGGYLTKAVAPDGTTANYTYDSAGKLLTAGDENVTVHFEYYKNRISTVYCTSPDGTETEYYQFGFSCVGESYIQTPGIDSDIFTNDDILTTINFDQFGRQVGSYSRVVSSESEDLGSSGASYTSGVGSARTVNKITSSHTVDKATDNLLVNHSMESTGHWISAYWDPDHCAFEADISSLDSYFGAKSYRINATEYSGKGKARGYQDVSNIYARPGKTYTLSGYIKVTYMSEREDEDCGAGLAAVSFNDDGKYEYFYSEIIKGVTPTDIDDGWQRVQVTFTVPENSTKMRINLYMRGVVGTAYYDGIQLEEGETATIYNMLENSGFEKIFNSSPSGWSYTGVGSESRTSTFSRYGNTCAKLDGGLSSDKRISQTVNVSRDTEDTYIISGWACADALPEPTDSSARYFSIFVDVNYSDGLSYPAKVMNFNIYSSGWQQISGVFDLSRSIDGGYPVSVTIELVFWNQANSVYFDGIKLSRDEAPSYVYDSDGHLISAVANAEQNRSYQYQNSDLTKVTDQNNKNVEYTYDGYHNVTNVTLKTGLNIEYLYSYGEDGSFGIPYGQVVVSKTTNEDLYAKYIDTKMVTSDNGSRIDFIQDSDAHKTKYTYDNRGRVSSMTTNNGTDYARTVNYSYFSANDDRLSSVSQGDINVNYGYNAKKQLSTIVHNGFNYNFTYDNAGNTKSIKIGDRTLSTYNYNANYNRLDSMMYGETMGGYYYNYNKNGSLKSLSYGIDDNTISFYNYFYDTFGNLSRKIDNVNGVNYNYTYDSTGRLIRKKADGRYAVNYAYDNDNNVSMIKSRSGGVTSTSRYYYSAGNITNTDFDNGSFIVYSYDGLDRLSDKNVVTASGKSLYHNYTYAESAQGPRLTTTKVETEIAADKKYYYTYYPTNEIAGVYIFESNDNEMVEPNTQTNYTYDDYGRLKSADYFDENGRMLKMVSYTYDNGGNILTETESRYGDNPGTYINTYTYGDDEWKDLLTEYNGQTITYDEIGNPIQYRDGMAFSWAYGRTLYAADYTSGRSEYQFDSDGMRLVKREYGKDSLGNNVLKATHDYQYEGGKLMSEIIRYTNGSTVKLYFYYDGNGTPTMLRYINGTTDTDYYLETNMFGDVMAIMNSQCEVVARYTYDAWGNILSITDSNWNDITNKSHIAFINPLRYRGYYYDEDTGLYYLQSRYYDPVTHRFINADGQLNIGSMNGCNLFAYCENNPVNRVDPTGQCFYNAHGVWSHDNWEYVCDDYVFKPEPATKLGKTNSGKNVYISESDDYCVAPGDVKVIDMRIAQNPDVQVRNSYIITDKSEQEQIIDFIIDYNNDYPSVPNWNRTKESLLIEWDAHNDIYNIKNNERCKHVDFDNADEGVSYVDFWKRAIHATLFE